METTEIKVEDIDVTGPKLGQGSYGHVSVGTWKGARVAVKSLHEVFLQLYRDDPQRDAILAEFHREMTLLVTLRHPNVLQFLGYVRDDDRPLMITELLHESLENRLEREPRMSEACTHHVLRSVACGLRYLHERAEPIVHRDLASKNVLLSRDGYQVKIADYGLAKAIETQKRTAKKYMYTATFNQGTELYAAPEVFGKAASQPPRDMFAYGVLALETILGFITMPLPRNDEENLVIVPEVERRREDLNQVPESHPLLKIIQRCLSQKAEKRPTASDVVKEFPPYDENDIFPTEVPRKNGSSSSKDGDDGGGESSTNRYETLLESVTTRHHALERAESVNEDLKEKLVSFQCNSLLKEHSLKTQLAKARSKPFPRSWHDMPNLPFTHKHPLLATIGDVMLACHCLSPTLYLMNATTCRLTTKLAHPHANEIDSMTTYKHHCYALTIYIKDNNTETKLEEFDVDTRTWTILASMPWKAALRYTSLVATSDAVYVVGGLNKASISVNYFVEVDLATGKTTELTPMPSYRSACSCAFVDGRLYVAGGFTRNADHSASMCDRFEVYRVKKSWKKLPSTHFGVSIVALRGETVISVGGVVPYSRDVKMFDRESKEWTELPPMIWERCMPGVCAVGACGIIVGGGATGNGEPLKSVEEMLLMKV